MKVSIRLFAIAIASMMAAQAGALVAQNARDQDSPQPSTAASSTIVSGTVVSTSSGSLAIKSDAGAQLSFTTDGGTTLPAELKPGDRIDVEYEMVAGGPSRAVRVTAEKPVAAPGATGTSGTDGAAPRDADPQMKKMPHTASWLPLIALMGTICLGASLAMRVVRRARA
jgi:hypothetical protein